ncbi:MAG: 4-hydroxy-tetrahydrodipicolinate reductase [Gammaproteobacteria bacterium]|nr:4-hydroxy-tetrahydrodipicolinate reductase [Gammaproteobacteria bacterium]
MTRVAVNGAAGRMGRTLIEAIGESDDLSLTAAFEHPDSDDVGTAVDGVRIGPHVAAGVADFDVLIDFTEPGATLAALEPCEAQGRGLVIGTTGFDAAGIDRIRAAAGRVPILMAPNMSVGVNVTFRLIEMAARALGDDVDVEVYEAHHRHKIDAPSGTAVRIGEILAETLGRDLSTDAVYGRVGITGARDTRTIGFHSARGGDIVGEHTVVFAGAGERIEITHRAQSRMNFAMGALRAVRFVAGRERGLYGMADVLSGDTAG